MALSRGRSSLSEGSHSMGRLQQLSASCNDKFLGKLLLSGIGYHSAALTSHDRSLVEDLFKKKEIRVLLTTSTLGSGVNLPAYLVCLCTFKTTSDYLLHKSPS